MLIPSQAPRMRRILTFNFHEPYLCLMAKTGFEFTVGLYSKPPFAREWQTKFRPVPPNIRFMEEAAWRDELESGKFDVVIAHNELNAASVLRYDAPMLLVCHNRRTFLKTTVQGDLQKGIRNYDELLKWLQKKFTFIFISESKRADYGIPGKVILPGIDVGEYGGYTGRVAEVLRVGNAMRARNLMFDVEFQEVVCMGLPNRVVGDDPAIPGARPSTSFEDLLDTFRSLRCLLHVTREEYEDGYNLAMLEAMACGMPVVSLANKTSPVTNGVDGYLSSDAEVLRGRLRRLLEDPEHARTIGERGRAAVQAKFPLSAFVEKWRAAIEEAAEQGSRRSRRAAARTPAPREEGEPAPPKKEPERAGPRRAPRMRIVLDCVPAAGSPAVYLERALRAGHHVMAVGPRSSLDEIPKSFKPDLYLWIDSNVLEVAPHTARLEYPKACYLINTQENLAERVALARQFDFVFVAQKGHVGEFVRAGISNVAWLPLACSSEALALGRAERARVGRAHDVALLGSPDDERRCALMEGIAARFPNSKVGEFPVEELAHVYAGCKAVVNVSTGRCLSMDVFEAMAAGGLLITDDADGLDELFEDGKHLVVFRDDAEALNLVEQHLANATLRETIAARGAALVQREHSYDERAHQMLTMILEALGRLGGPTGESRFHFGGYYRAPRLELVQHIPGTVRRFLDVGCGGGELGRVLKQRGVKEVVGIEVIERAWEVAKHNLDDALLGNIEEMTLPFEDGYFDCICFADVLEHLVNPTEVLRKVARVLAPEGVIVMSIPNARFCQVVEMLAHGRWRYEDAGILDRTHLRFFTAFEMRELVKEAGLDLVKMQPLSMLSPEKLPRSPDGSLAMGRMTFKLSSDAEYKDFLTYQYLVVAGKPTADRLSSARRALEDGNYEAAYHLAQDAGQGDLAADEFERTRIMAKAVARLGKLDTAESLYRKALELRPDDATVSGELGIVLVAQNRVQDAQPLLEKALEAGPENDRVLGALGLVHLAREEIAEAFARFKACLDFQFNNEPILSHLIETARRLGHLAEAEPRVRRFVDFYPGNVTMTYQHAALLYEQGKLAEARDRLETLLLLVPNHEAANELLRKIIAGESA